MPTTTPAPSEAPSDDGDDNDDEENIHTPIRPSAKALGKRQLMNVEDPDPDALNRDDIFYERTDGRDTRIPIPDDSGISGSDSNSDLNSRVTSQLEDNDTYSSSEDKDANDQRWFRERRRTHHPNTPGPTSFGVARR
ncbi:hypothetical protein BJV78DRAFT_1287212 [Lactifluus subvellereus]|nr:hypothetical protein BJV78DRAFT_1287212 [Lactifluus subvellereus]